MESSNIEKRGFSHFTIYTDIEIDAAPEQVWEVLTDTASYKNWAAFMVDLQGDIAEGATVTAAFQLNPEKEKRISISHTIQVQDGQEFSWAEKGPGGIVDNHHFRVEAAAGGTARFVQSDELKKGLTWLMGGKLSKMYRDGYRAFNQALKAEVERRYAAA